MDMPSDVPEESVMGKSSFLAHEVKDRPFTRSEKAKGSHLRDEGMSSLRFEDINPSCPPLVEGGNRGQGVRTPVEFVSSRSTKATSDINLDTKVKNITCHSPISCEINYENRIKFPRALPVPFLGGSDGLDRLSPKQNKESTMAVAKFHNNIIHEIYIRQKI